MEHVYTFSHHPEGDGGDRVQVKSVHSPEVYTHHLQHTHHEGTGITGMMPVATVASMHSDTSSPRVCVL